ncbi:Acid sugar phosphatase OS=Streptomyces fumanus OX=67302 GN=GCM10018772_06950 PE=3 SV=1 [Streptomyces fumanus]
MADRRPIESWLTDMDGVLIHEGVPIPGADAFLKLCESGKPFLVLTNNSIYTSARSARPACAAWAWRCRSSRSGLPRWPPPSSWTTSGPAARPTSSARPA